MNKYKAWITPVCVIGATGFLTILSPWLVSTGSNMYVKMLLSFVPYFLIAIMALVFLKGVKIFSKKNLWRQLIVGVLLGAILSLVIFVLPKEHNSDIINPLLIYKMFYYMVAAPVAEELLFRGYLYEKIKLLSDSAFASAISSAILFGGWHFMLSHNIMLAVISTALGLALGLARYKLKNCTVLSTIIAHGLYNGLNLFLG
ncbi:MAG: CPBP family intramembrane glutamic endopeptidase [Oscillospiraceae bacterium]